MFAVRSVVGWNVTAAGTVQDARTQKPVVGAAIETGEETPKHGHTNAAGHFRVLEVHAGSGLTISAPNYHPAHAKASSDAVRVMLRPIPVTGTVKSTFTGKAIRASVASGKVRQDTDGNGSFTVFGVGPGDSLSISAFGHQTSSVKIGKDRKVNASINLGRIDADRVLATPSGYALANVPKDLVDALRSDIAYGDPQFAIQITGMSMKSVIRNGETIGVATAIAVDPAWAVLPGAQEGFYQGFSSGTPLTKTTIGDTTVRRAEADGLVGMAWQHYAAFVFVLGEDGKQVEAITRALILGGATSSA